MQKGKWAKLSGGDWGARFVAEDPFDELPKEGDEVIVVTQKGKESVRKVKSVVWEGETDGKFGTTPGMAAALYALD